MFMGVGGKHLDLQGLWANGAQTAWAAMDGDVDSGGNEGLVGNFSVTSSPWNEALEEGITVTVPVEPSPHSEWYEVAC